MSVSQLSDAELVQWLALHDVIEAGHQYGGRELAVELDRRFGVGAMNRVDERSTRWWHDPFESVAEAFRAPNAVVSAARGEHPPAPNDAQEGSRYLAVALAHAATAARRASGSAQPRLNARTAVIMAEELVRSGWPAQLDSQDRW